MESEKNKNKKKRYEEKLRTFRRNWLWCSLFLFCRDFQHPPGWVVLAAPSEAAGTTKTWQENSSIFTDVPSYKSPFISFMGDFPGSGCLKMILWSVAETGGSALHEAKNKAILTLEGMENNGRTIRKHAFFLGSALLLGSLCSFKPGTIALSRWVYKQPWQNMTER